MTLGPGEDGRLTEMGSNSSPDTSSGANRLNLPPDEIVFGCTSAMLAMRHQLEKVCRTNIPMPGRSLLQVYLGSTALLLFRSLRE